MRFRMLYLGGPAAVRRRPTWAARGRWRGVRSSPATQPQPSLALRLRLGRLLRSAHRESGHRGAGWGRRRSGVAAASRLYRRPIPWERRSPQGRCPCTPCPPPVDTYKPLVHTRERSQHWISWPMAARYRRKRWVWSLPIHSPTPRTLPADRSEDCNMRRADRIR